MKTPRVLLTLAILTLVAGCKSEIDNQTPAQVSEAAPPAPAGTAPTATDAASGPVSNVIKEKSSIEFVGAKVTRDHHGRFNQFDGRIEYQGGTPSRIAFEIDLTSLQSDHEKLTEHLKSPDFFDVATHQKATFTSSSVTPAPAGSPGGATHILKGTLDLHGVRKDVTIPVVTQSSSEGIRTRSEFTINRHDWGVSYRGAADDLIKDNVLIKLNLLFTPPPMV